MISAGGEVKLLVRLVWGSLSEELRSEFEGLGVKGMITWFFFLEMLFLAMYWADSFSRSSSWVGRLSSSEEESLERTLWV